MTKAPMRKLRNRAGLQTLLWLMALILSGWPLAGLASAPATVCVPAIVNREDCAIHIEREQPISPLPLKIRPGHRAWIVTEKRPLEDIKSVVTSTELPRPDVLAALLGSLNKSLPAVQLATHVSGAVDTSAKPRYATESESHVCTERDARSRQLLLAQAAWAQHINDLGVRQRSIDNALSAQRGRVDALSKNLKQLQSFAPPRPWIEKAGTGPACFVNMLRVMSAHIKGESPDPGTPCDGFDQAKWQADQGLQPLPSGDLELSADEVNAVHSSYVADLQAFKRQVDSLESDRPEITSCQDFQRLKSSTSELVARAPGQIANLRAAQSQLTARLATELQGEAALGPIAQTLSQRADTIERDPKAAIVDVHSYSASADEHGIQSKTVKLSTQQALGGDSADLASVSLSWVDSHWEISTGVMYSNVLSRSFQNAPIIQNGQPVLDSSGKTLTVVSQTTSKPVVVPFVFVHYRLPLDIECGARRCAFFLSGGVGVSTQSGASADFALGPTFSYGNFMFTPALHFTRDIRLSNGVKVGQELGPQPPALPTEKYWVHKVGLALTYNLPIT